MTNEHAPYVALTVAVAVVAMAATTRYRHQFVVNAGDAGVLYHEDQIVETLLPGRHVRWGRNYRVVTVDTRKTFLAVGNSATFHNVSHAAPRLVTHQSPQVMARIDLAESPRSLGQRGRHLSRRTSDC